MKAVDGDCHSRTLRSIYRAVGLPTESMNEKTKPLQEEKNSKHSSPQSKRLKKARRKKELTKKKKKEKNNLATHPSLRDRSDTEVCSLRSAG